MEESTCAPEQQPAAGAEQLSAADAAAANSSGGMRDSPATGPALAVQVPAAAEQATAFQDVDAGGGM